MTIVAHSYAGSSRKAFSDMLALARRAIERRGGGAERVHAHGHGSPCGGDCVTVPAEVDALTADRDALQARLDEATSTIDTLEAALRDLQADRDEERAENLEPIAGVPE